MSEYKSNLYNELLVFQESSERTKIWTKLSKKDRGELIYNANALGFFAMLIEKGVQKKKVLDLLVQKDVPSDEQLNYLTQQTFCIYAGVRLRPSLSRELFLHDLKQLFPYFPSARKYDSFCKEVNEKGGILKWKEYTRQVKNEILIYLKKQWYYKKFQDWEVPKFYQKKEKLYQPNHDRRWFISLDLKQSNFSVLKFFVSHILQNKDAIHQTWEGFLSQFTNSEFLISSKPFRGIIFGLSGIDYKTTQLAPLLIQKGMEIADQYLKLDKWEILSNLEDEVIYQKTVLDDEIKTFTSYECTKEELQRRYPDQFHLRMFQLIQIDKTMPHFVKEHVNGTREIKNCSEEHLLSSIEMYQDNCLWKFISDFCK